MARGKVNGRDIEEDALMMGEGVEKVKIFEMEEEEDELLLKVKRGRVKVFATDDNAIIMQFTFLLVLSCLFS
ncbi:hypothetical protein L195_g010843 [Trifolium pratense]|uniref:Uncharacterized protein n=1 Tax=Trifolium pratense TaxID=57577 RepID=A0A2K3PFU9_TRIPR|nr:hypothetical protein L195_g010843 [Trifolium pratense]